MTTRSRWDAGSQIFFEDAKMETVAAMAPVQFSEEFIGAGHSAGFPTSATAGYAWIKKIVGAAPPTAALVANGAAGVAQLALTSTSEKQEATLYFADNLALDVTKKLQAEFTAALTVAPSAASVQAVFGLAQAWADGPDNIARYLEFGFTANNTLLLRSYDGTTFYSVIAALRATPTVAIAADANPHLYRIDASDLTDIGFYFDGNRVNAQGSVAWSASASNSKTQVYQSVYKPSGTGVATLQIDRVDVWANRS
ncbi:hypothetical+protein [Methylocapsa aurea]|uniref:hypothetical protein n=1 Tax=Methylocapsa aurea TaxID=663610 RepID=UPI003D18EDE0